MVLNPLVTSAHDRFTISVLPGGVVARSVLRPSRAGATDVVRDSFVFATIRRDTRRVFRRRDVSHRSSCSRWTVSADVVSDVLVGPTNDVGALSVVAERVVARGVFFARFAWDAHVVGNFLMDSTQRVIAGTIGFHTAVALIVRRAGRARRALVIFHEFVRTASNGSAL